METVHDILLCKHMGEEGAAGQIEITINRQDFIYERVSSPNEEEVLFLVSFFISGIPVFFA